MSKRLLPPDEELIELYTKEHKTCADICEMFGLSKNSRSNVSLKLRKHGIKIRKENNRF